MCPVPNEHSFQHPSTTIFWILQTLEFFQFFPNSQSLGWYEKIRYLIDWSIWPLDWTLTGTTTLDPSRYPIFLRSIWLIDWTLTGTTTLDPGRYPIFLRSIWPLDRTLTCTTTPDPSRYPIFLRSIWLNIRINLNRKEEVHSLNLHNRSLTIRCHHRVKPKKPFWLGVILLFWIG